MGTTFRPFSPLVVSLCSLFGPFACGGQAAPERQSATAGGTGGSVVNQAGAAGQIRSAAGAAGVAGTSGVCPVEQAVEAPIPSTDCQVVVRQIDPVLTCGSTDCAISKALDLTCTFMPDATQIVATADGAVVMVRTRVIGGNGEYLARLMTVGAADSWLRDVPALADPNPGYSYDASIADSVLATSASGAKWLFAGDAPGINAVRETDLGWTRATVVSPVALGEEKPYLTDARIVDDKLGYLTYCRQEGSATRAHLVTWDGSCWTDETIAATQTESMVVNTDEQGRPWIAWISGGAALYLRSPSGDTQDLLANDTGNVLAPGVERHFHYVLPLHLLPGGIDGTAAFPAAAARFQDGIRLLSKDPTTDAGWLSLLLPDSAPDVTATSDCPWGNAPVDVNNRCFGLDTCTGQLRGTSFGFDLVRTQSGATFVAWVEYSSDGTYSLTEDHRGGEMPAYFCYPSETSGQGTADLVLARITESEPILTHFRFDLGGAISSLSRDIAMAARGDTLLVAAYLSGDNIPSLTYLEIDSTRLQ
jgi:hypothetical protein